MNRSVLELLTEAVKTWLLSMYSLSQVLKYIYFQESIMLANAKK